MGGMKQSIDIKTFWNVFFLKISGSIISVSVLIWRLQKENYKWVMFTCKIHLVIQMRGISL